MQLGASLKKSGVKAGDKVVVFGETTGEWMIVNAAIQLVGAVTVGLHPGFAGQQALVVLQKVLEFDAC